ncbi:MAG: PKD domain-containing protein [Dehalococcoidia bacterium]|nr:PKD domain-containing protein [Dehalococcoidia bacterium]
MTIAGGSARVAAQAPPPVDIFVEEGIGVGDGTEADPPTTVSNDESITVSDDVAVIGPVNITVNDGVTVGDDPGLVSPAVIDVEDDVTVDDDPGVIGPVVIDVEDDVTVSDDPGVIGPAVIDVEDAVAVSDDADVVGPVVIDVEDDVAVSDDADVIGPAVIDVEDEVVVTDDPSVIPPALIDVNEMVFVEDNGGPVSSTPIVDAGASITTFESKAVTLKANVITLNPELTTAVIDWGDEGFTDTASPDATGAISVLHLYDSDGIFTVTVTVTGPFGESGADTTQVTVLNHAPFVDAGGPYGGATSAAIVLTAEATDPGGDPLTYAWDFDDDGQFDDASGQTVMFSSPTPGVFPVAVRATDDGGLDGSDTANVTIGATVLAESTSQASLVPPSIDSPADGSNLTTTWIDLEWAPNDYQVDFWTLHVGITPGGVDLHNSGLLPATVTSMSVNLAPASPVYARLFYSVDGAWEYVEAEYTVTLDANPPEVRWDTDNGNPSGTSGTIVWTHDDARVTEYRVLVGTSVGASDIYDSGSLAPTQKSLDVAGLPADDSPIFVRFISKDNKLTFLHIFDLVNLGENEYQVTYGQPPVDDTAPVTTIEFAGQHTLSSGTHFITRDTQIYFLSSDVNPVSIEYFVDHTPFLPAYPFKLTQPGLYEISYRASDSEGNVEATKTASVSVSGPVTTRLGSLEGVVDDSGPEITLRAIRSGGDGPVKAGDRIVVKAAPVGGSDSTGAGSGGFDDWMDGPDAFEVIITSGSDTDKTDVNWETPETGQWIFTVPVDAAGKVIDIQVVATGKNGKTGAPASVQIEVLSEFTVELEVTPTSIENFGSVNLTATPDNLGPSNNVRRYRFYQVRQNGQPLLIGSTTSNSLEAPLGTSDSSGIVTVFVVAQTALGLEAQSNLVDVNIVRGSSGPDDSAGRVSGRAAIGTLIRFESKGITIATDTGALSISANLGILEVVPGGAGTDGPGSRVVVIADRDLSDPQARAVSIAFIPDPNAKAKREHKRAVVAAPDFGNLRNLLDGDGNVLGTGDFDNIDTVSGDQVVVIVNTDRQGRETGVEIFKADVGERLNGFAQDKFDEGKAAAAASIDQLRSDHRKQDEAFAEKISGHTNADISDAGKAASNKIDDAKEKEAADPLTAIRKHAAADAEEDILTCAAGVVGRPVAGEFELTLSEVKMVEEACLDEEDKEGARGIPSDFEARELPPDDVINCIIGEFGELPTSLSETDKQRLDDACGTNKGSDDAGPPTDDLTKFCAENPDLPECWDPCFDDPSDLACFCFENPWAAKCQPEDPVTQSNARKTAFCVANLAHPNCVGFDPLFDPDEIDFDSSTPWAGGGDGGKGDIPDFTEGDPDDRDALLEKLCREKPEDEKCGGDGTDSGKDDPEDSDTLEEEDDSDVDRDAKCALRPTDPHCTGESGKDDGGGSSGATDDGGGHTGTKDDGGDSGTDDGGGDGQTGTKDGRSK